jgi:transposase InsO family protein
MRPVGVSIQRAGLEQNPKKRVREMGNKNLSKEQLLDVLKMTVDNGPEFLSGEFVAWAESVGMMIHYIQPGEPNQNAYIERFNIFFGIRSICFCV